MEKDKTTRAFAPAGSDQNQVVEIYPQDNSGDQSKYIPLGVVAARTDVYLSSGSRDDWTIWTIRSMLLQKPTSKARPLPPGLLHGEQFTTSYADIAAAANEVDRRVGKSGTTIMTS